MNETRTGSCLCGAIRFTTRGAPRGVVYCHCSQCRRQMGHYCAATNVRDEDLDVEGARNLTWYRASGTARRGFCSTCGSALFWKGDGLDRTSIMAGSFDRPSGLKGEMHIFAADKGDYYDLTDDLPRFEGWGGGVEPAGE